jgi:ribosomal protein S18 acetylase RimI-like enzyme
MTIIKEPTVADSDGIKAIFLESQFEAFVHTLPPSLLWMMNGMDMNTLMEEMAGFDHEEMLADCVDDFLSERNRCVIMVEDSKTIGYCLASVEMSMNFGKLKRIIGIGEVYIKKEYRSKGMGSALVKEFINLMNRKEACSIITVLDEKQFKPAIVKLFENNGFILEKVGYKLKLNKKKHKVDYEIRNAVLDDYEGYAKLVINMYKSFESFDENIYNGAEVIFSRRYYFEELRDPDCLHTVCEIDNEIAGICMLKKDGTDLSIHTVSVDDKYAKMGVATSLYHSAFNFAIENGYSEIAAVVFAQNKASCKFHEHMMMRVASRRYIHKTTHSGV